MGTTILPMASSGPDDLGYCGDVNLPTPRSLSETQLRRLIESKKSPKQIIKEAQGVLAKGKKKKPKTYKAGKNLATEAKGKRGPFGQKVETPLKGKGVRVAESERFEIGLRRFREHGIKGMKWGSRKDKEIDRHVSNAVAAGGGKRLADIQGSARKAGTYSEKHMDALSNLNEHHTNAADFARSDPEEQRHDTIATHLGNALAAAGREGIPGIPPTGFRHGPRGFGMPVGKYPFRKKIGGQ